MLCISKGKVIFRAIFSIHKFSMIVIANKIVFFFIRIMISSSFFAEISRQSLNQITNNFEVDVNLSVLWFDNEFHSRYSHPF